MEVSGETGCVGSLEGGEEETAAVGGVSEAADQDAGEDCQARAVSSWPDSCRQAGNQMEQ